MIQFKPLNSVISGLEIGFAKLETNLTDMKKLLFHQIDFCILISMIALVNCVPRQNHIEADKSLINDEPHQVLCWHNIILMADWSQVSRLTLSNTPPQQDSLAKQTIISIGLVGKDSLSSSYGSLTNAAPDSSTARCALRSERVSSSVS